MKPSLLAFVLVTIFAATCSLQAERSKPKNTGPSSEDPSNKDAIHLVARSPADLKQIFTYFPYPDIPAQYRFARISGTGNYRLTVSPQGNVVEIKILKKMGVFGDWPADVTALKTLIHWRAQPGLVLWTFRGALLQAAALLPTKDRIFQGANLLVFQLMRKETP